MARRKRIYAWLLCMVIALVLFVSSAYAVHEAGHVCCRANCPVCEIVRQMEALVRVFMLIAGLTLATVALGQMMPVFRIAAGTPIFAPCTLISWKVRLNN